MLRLRPSRYFLETFRSRCAHFLRSVSESFVIKGNDSCEEGCSLRVTFHQCDLGILVTSPRTCNRLICRLSVFACRRRPIREVFNCKWASRKRHDEPARLSRTRRRSGGFPCVFATWRLGVHFRIQGPDPQCAQADPPSRLSANERGIDQRQAAKTQGREEELIEFPCVVATFTGCGQSPALCYASA